VLLALPPVLALPPPVLALPPVLAPAPVPAEAVEAAAPPVPATAVEAAACVAEVEPAGLGAEPGELHAMAYDAAIGRKGASP
jgi:hypothetical protein